jgi:hypothetical protein
VEYFFMNGRDGIPLKQSVILLDGFGRTAHDVRGYKNAFKHGVRIHSQQVAILECSGLSFRRVTYNVTRRAG